MALMARYPDNYFDLAIVDPPYGISVNMNAGRKKDTKSKKRTVKKWDNEIPTKEYFDELFRVSKNQIIWGGNYFDLPPTRCFIIWNKNQPWDNFSQAEFAWTSFDKPAKLFTHSNRGGNNEETKIHPTQKPIYLYDYCLKHFSEDGMKILDTHLGSASIAIASDKYNVELVACDLNKVYFDDAVKRLKNSLSQQKLF